MYMMKNEIYERLVLILVAVIVAVTTTYLLFVGSGMINIFIDELIPYLEYLVSFARAFAIDLIIKILLYLYS